MLNKASKKIFCLHAQTREHRERPKKQRFFYQLYQHYCEYNFARVFFLHTMMNKNCVNNKLHFQYGSLSFLLKTPKKKYFDFWRTIFFLFRMRGLTWVGGGVASNFTSPDFRRTNESPILSSRHVAKERCFLEAAWMNIKTGLTAAVVVVQNVNPFHWSILVLLIFLLISAK